MGRRTEERRTAARGRQRHVTREWRERRTARRERRGGLRRERGRGGSDYALPPAGSEPFWLGLVLPAAVFGSSFTNTATHNNTTQHGVSEQWKGMA